MKSLNGLFFLLFLSTQFLSAQDHPGTGTVEPAGNCTPTGWSLDAGSPDVSDVNGWGFTGDPGTPCAKGAPMTWSQPISNPPNGETRWLTAHSTEVSSMEITGLTAGDSYTLEFYYMSSTVTTPYLGGYGGKLSTTIRYKIDGGTVVSKPIAAGGTWYKENVVFTAKGTSATFVYLGGDNDGFAPGSATQDGDLTNISFKPNGTVPTVPACPTVTVTAPFTSSICSGESINISATGPAEPNYTYTWQPGGMTGTTITVSPTDTTYYQVIVDSAGCKGNASSIVLVNPLPIVTVNSETICSGQTATLTASGATDYAWSPGTNLSGTTTASVTSTRTADITYTVTGTTDGCSGTAASTVTIASGLAITVNSETICSGQTATLTASGATDYTWSPATDLSGTTTASVTSTRTADITYTVTGNTNGCIGTAEATVTIGASAPSNAGGDISLCSGVVGNLGDVSTAGYTYSWSPATDLSSSTISNPTVMSTNATSSDVVTTYTLTAGPAGCTSTDEVVVTILADDDATFSYTPSTVCKTGGADPIASTTTPGGTFSGTAGLAIDASSGLITLASTAIGTYTVTYTTAGTCPASSDFVITIVNVPDATFSYAGPYCQSAPNPSPIFPAGSSAGIFSSAAGLVFANTGTGEINLLSSTPGTYTVTNTIAAGGGCAAATAENTIVVNAAPVTTVNNETVCSGGSATLTAGGANAYSWSDGSSAGTLTVNPLSTSSYTVTGTTGGCSSSAIATVTANATPTVTVNDATVCAGESATLTGNGATSYVWNDGSITPSLTAAPANTTSFTVTGTSNACSASAIGTITVKASPIVSAADAAVCGGLPASITANGATSYVWSNAGEITTSITVSPNTTTQYTVTGTTDGCTGMATPTVVVSTTPTVTVSSNMTICEGESVSVTASGADTYVWSNGDGAATINVSPTVPTSYTVTGTSSGCSDTKVFSVQVNPVPEVAAVSDVICLGETATMTASGADSYAWSPTIGGGTGSSVSGSPTITTNYTVTGTSLTCSSIATASITVQPLPSISVNDGLVCPGEVAVLTASGGTTYLWSNGSIGNSITVAPSSTTFYSVTGSNGGCPLTANSQVTVSPQPTAAFGYSPDPAGVLNPVISFNDQSRGEVNYWNWNFGDGDSTLTNTQNPIHEYPAIETSYVVTLDVKNAGGCTDTISRTVIIGPEFTFFVPNAFSPNEDGKNDAFLARGGGILEYKMLVFDRWGNQLFFTSDLDTAWDGNYLGALCQEDVYIWRVELVDVFKKEHTFLGTVTIVQ